jgi:hypothetical protein
MICVLSARALKASYCRYLACVCVCARARAYNSAPLQLRIAYVCVCVCVCVCVSVSVSVSMSELVCIHTCTYIGRKTRHSFILHTAPALTLTSARINLGHPQHHVGRSTRKPMHHCLGICSHITFI